MAIVETLRRKSCIRPSRIFIYSSIRDPVREILLRVLSEISHARWRILWSDGPIWSTPQWAELITWITATTDVPAAVPGIVTHWNAWHFADDWAYRVGTHLPIPTAWVWVVPQPAWVAARFRMTVITGQSWPSSIPDDFTGWLEPT